MRVDGVHFFLNTSTFPNDIKYEIWKHTYPDTLLTCCICNTILLEETYSKQLQCKKKYTCIEDSYKCMDCIYVKSVKCTHSRHYSILTSVSVSIVFFLGMVLNLIKYIITVHHTENVLV